ncbi:MAG: T9SS type A sorting domain-containing protein [Candidatus Delongbacteria bacterium]
MTRVLLSVLALAGVLQAQWPEDPALNFAVCDRAGEQTLPKLAATSDGGCYVSWQDHGAGNYDTWLQRLDAEGQPVWADGGLLLSDHPQETWITDYDLAVDAQDHAIVAINDIRDGADRDITAYRISPAGEFAWGPDGLAVSRNEGFEPDPQICVTTEGNIVFAWQEDSVLHLRKVSPAGLDLWDPVSLTLSATYALSIPRLAAAPDDGVLLQYLEAQGSQFWSPKHLYLQRFDAAGQPAWEGPGAAVSTAGGFGPQMRPELLGDGAGGAFCYWYDSRNNQLHAYAQHLLADGGAGWTANGVLLSTTASELQDQPRVVLDEVGAGPPALELYYRITDLDQNLAGIAGQRLSWEGERQWGASGRVLHALSSQNRQSVIATRGLADSSLVGHLEFPVGDVLHSRLVVEAVREDGEAGWEPALVTASSTASSRGYLSATAGARGQLLAVWQDQRDDASGDILLQNVNPDGSLGAWEDTNLPAPAGRPTTPDMLAAWPNPFNPSTRVALELPGAGTLRLSVHDLRGAEVARLLDGWQPAGRQVVDWNAAGLPSGSYWLRLETAGGRKSLRVTLLK